MLPAGTVLAIDIGGTQYSAALVGPAGRLLRRRSGTTDRQAGAAWMIARILAEGRRLLALFPGRVRGCGVGFGGPVDFAAQRVVSSTHVPGWEDVPLAHLLEQELGVPVVVENDANAGALGEYAFGAGRQSRHLVYCTISTGIGGGIVLDGQIYRGSDGNAGELGHLPVLPDGPRCDCGNRGCLEALCSGKSIGLRAAAEVRRHPRQGQRLQEAAGGGQITARAVFDAARQGDPLAGRIVGETCLYLGMGLAGLMNTLAPDRIVVGGGVSKAGAVLFAPLREQAARFTMPVHRPHLRIAPARRRGSAVLLGAAVLARTVI